MNYETGPAKFVFEHVPPPIRNSIASAYGAVQRRRRQGKYYRAHLDSLRESQWWPAQRLAALQLQISDAVQCGIPRDRPAAGEHLFCARYTVRQEAVSS